MEPVKDHVLGVGARHALEVALADQLHRLIAAALVGELVRAEVEHHVAHVVSSFRISSLASSLRLATFGSLAFDQFVPDLRRTACRLPVLRIWRGLLARRVLPAL